MTTSTFANRRWLALAAVSIASFLGCVDFTVVNTALPALQQHFGVSVRDLQWIINGFILALSSTAVLFGRVADLFGRRRVLYLGLIVFGLASLWAGFAGSVNELIVARVLQGLACSVLYTASGAIVANTFAPEEQGRAFGILFGVNGIGLAVGPVAGGLITNAFGWQWIFLVNIPFVLLSLGLMRLSVSESRAAIVGRLDWIGSALLLIGLPSLILVIVQGSTWGWTSPAILGTLSLSILALIAFVIVELRVSSPIVDLRLFANRAFVASATASAGLAVFYCVAFFVMPLYLSVVRHESAAAIGWLLLPTTLGVALLSPVVGRLVDRHGPAPLLKAGLSLFVVSAAIQATFSAQTSIVIILTAFVLMGIAWAAILGPSTVQAMSSVPADSSSLAIGSVMTLHNIGGGIGIAVGVGIYRYFAAGEFAGLSTTPAATPWLQDAISNPEHAVQLFSTHLSIPHDTLTQWVETSFVQGYQTVMLFLVATTLISLAIVTIALRQPKTIDVTQTAKSTAE